MFIRLATEAWQIVDLLTDLDRVSMDSWFASRLPKDIWKWSHHSRVSKLTATKYWILGGGRAFWRNVHRQVENYLFTSLPSMKKIKKVFLSKIMPIFWCTFSRTGVVPRCDSRVVRHSTLNFDMLGPGPWVCASVMTILYISDPSITSTLCFFKIVRRVLVP